MSGATFTSLCACSIGIALLVVTFAFQPAPRVVTKATPCAPVWSDLGITPAAGGGAGMGHHTEAP